MIQVPKNEVLESLKEGYFEVKNCLENGSSAEDIAHVKGFCVTIEQLLSAYGNVSKEEMEAIKEPIIGSLSLRRKSDKKGLENINLEEPTIFRRESKS